jgi:hypothetical protein
MASWETMLGILPGLKSWIQKAALGLSFLGPSYLHFAKLEPAELELKEYSLLRRFGMDLSKKELAFVDTILIRNSKHFLRRLGNKGL